MTRRTKASVAFIFVTLLLDTLGIGIIVPVLPRLIESFVGGDVSLASHYYGVFIALYAVMQFVFAPILGGLSDRFGRRKVILSSLFGGGLDYLLMAAAPALPWLFLGRVISGISGASFSAATAYIADVTPKEKRAASFGLIGVAFGLGFIVGPALGGVLGHVHTRLPFVAAAVLNLMNFTYGLFVLPESLPPEDRRPFSWRRANSLSSLKSLARHPVVLGLSGTLVCSSLAQQILQSTWALYGQGRYGFTEMDVGISLAVVGVASAIIQGGIVRFVVPRLGERRALAVGTTFSVAGFTAFGLATRGWMLYALTFPFSLRGIAGPAAQSLLTSQVGPSEQGELQGSLTSLMSVTAIVGPIVGTSLFARFGDASATPFVPGAPFFAAALLDAIGLALAVRLFSHLRTVGGPHAKALVEAAPVDEPGGGSEAP
jgi:DHA1 family tetracycline resistance protein-like MFS transporter